MALVDLLARKQRASMKDVEQTVAEIQTVKDNAKGSAKIGNMFEKELEATLKIYEALGLAFIQKFTPPTIWVNEKRMANGEVKQGYMVHTAKTGFDYVGGSIVDGKPIFIEAKSTWESRIDVYHEKHGIKEHQLRRMLWIEENTPFTVFFLWQVRKLSGTVYKFTPTQLLNAIGEKKSLTVADAEEAQFPRMIKSVYEGQLFYDFMYYINS